MSAAEFGDSRIPENVWGKIRVDAESGCWLWDGGVNTCGYASGGWEGRTRQMHRVLYLVLVGPIPAGLECDHLCRVRRCVNPAHIEIVTQRENFLRSNAPAAVNARKTHCKRGHPLSGENLSLFEQDGKIKRRCVACMRMHARRQKARLRARRNLVTRCAWCDDTPGEASHTICAACLEKHFPETAEVCAANEERES